jgi:MFS family permease
VAEGVSVGQAPGSLRHILVPLALAQFVCSFAGSNMNVMINDISRDLDTTVQGVQTAITVFLLVMAALMIPGGKLTDRWGRKRCFTVGLIVYGSGAMLSAVSPGLGVLILGNSILEGVGTALLIPPVYILTTLLFGKVTSRARAFGIITGMGGVGAAAGPLIGGLITDRLAGGVRLPSPDRRGDRLSESLDRRSRRGRPAPPLRHAWGGLVCRRSDPRRHGRPLG